MKSPKEAMMKRLKKARDGGSVDEFYTAAVTLLENLESELKSTVEIKKEISSLRAKVNVLEVELSEAEREIAAAKDSVEAARYEGFEDAGTW